MSSGKKHLNSIAWELGRRLLDGGLLGLAPLLGFPRLEDLSEFEQARLVGEIETFTASTLLTDFQDLTYLEVIAEQLFEMEDALLNVLAHLARREINTVNGLPTLSTLAASHAETLKMVSVRKGPMKDLYAETWNTIAAAAKAKIDGCLEKKVLLPRDLTTFKTVQIAAHQVYIAQMLLSEAQVLCQVLVSVIDTSAQAHMLPARTDEETLYRRYVDYMASKKNLLTLKNSPENAFAWKAAQDMVVERDYHMFTKHIDRQFDKFDRLLSSFMDYERKTRHTTSKERAFEIENFFHIERLVAQLQLSGETLEEARRLATVLFQYSMKNNVAVSEVLDEEILTMCPRINRENLIRARLELRLNDGLYPLSVAHKDWITQVTEH